MKVDQNAGSAATPARLPPRGRTVASPPAIDAAAARAGTASVQPDPDPADGAFNAEKVAAIREEIRSGRYQINPERIAERLLASLGDLTRVRQG